MTVNKNYYYYIAFLSFLSLAIKAGQIRCGEHSDYGSVTLLFQDDIGGLQVLCGFTQRTSSEQCTGPRPLINNIKCI